MRVLRAILLGGAGLTLLLLAWLFFVWPPPSWYRTHWPSRTAFMQMRQRQLLAARQATPRRYLPVGPDSIAEWLGKAATAAEDDAFYLHHGIDWRQLGQAVGYRRSGFQLADRRDRAELSRALGNAWNQRELLRGASTITQQLAKNLYLSPTRNPLRKLKEAAIAYRLEWALPKERILALYLNVAEFGPNLWGVEAASRAYFDRGANHLSLQEAALLIATLPHPLTSNPGYRPGRTLARAELIMRHLRGEPVEVPVEEPADTLIPVPVAPIVPSVPRDTIALSDTLLRSETAARKAADSTKPQL